MPKPVKKPVKQAKPVKASGPGWNPPAKGPARDRYTQEYIAGKLANITRLLGGK